jgi:hypothetical protein
LLAASTLALSHAGLADSLLAGSNLAAASQGGAVLCPESSNCSLRAEQFTLTAPTVINSLQVVLSGPSPSQSLNGSFSISLGSQLGAMSTLIGSGNLLFTANQNLTSELFDFTNLDLTLAAGTYYLDFSGANAELDYAPSVLTTDGSFGTEFSCDPTEQNCDASSSWDAGTNKFGTYAVDLNGTAITSFSQTETVDRTEVTPEPSTLLLFATGIVALIVFARRKFAAS